MPRRVKPLALVLVIAVSLIWLVSPALAQGTSAYWVETNLYIRNNGSESSNITIEVPLVMLSSLYGELVIEEFSLKPVEIVLGDNGERKGIFSVKGLAPGEEIVFTQRHMVSVESRFSGPLTEITDLVEYSKAPHEDAGIRRMAWNLTNDLATNEEKALALLRFTNEYIRYDASSPWRNQGALKALKYGEGVCEEYATLFVALSRAAGLESRLVYGYVKTKNSSNFERHSWAEFFLPEEGWIPVDPTAQATPIYESTTVYVPQWYQEEPIRVRFVGGSLSASRSEAVAAAYPR